MKAVDLFSMLKTQQAAMMAALHTAGLEGPAIEGVLESAGLTNRQIQTRVDTEFPGSETEVWTERVNALDEVRQAISLLKTALEMVPPPPSSSVSITLEGFKCRPLPRQQQQPRQPKPQQDQQQLTSGNEPGADPGPFHKLGSALVARNGDQFVIKLPDGSREVCPATSAELHKVLRAKGAIGEKTRYALPAGLRG